MAVATQSVEHGHDHSERWVSSELLVVRKSPALEIFLQYILLFSSNHTLLYTYPQSWLFIQKRATKEKRVYMESQDLGQSQIRESSLLGRLTSSIHTWVSFLATSPLDSARGKPDLLESEKK